MTIVAEHKTAFNAKSILPRTSFASSVRCTAFAARLSSQCLAEHHRWPWLKPRRGRSRVWPSTTCQHRGPDPKIDGSAPERWTIAAYQTPPGVCLLVTARGPLLDKPCALRWKVSADAAGSLVGETSPLTLTPRNDGLLRLIVSTRLTTSPHAECTPHDEHADETD